MWPLSYSVNSTNIYKQHLRWSYSQTTLKLVNSKIVIFMNLYKLNLVKLIYLGSVLGSRQISLLLQTWSKVTKVCSSHVASKSVTGLCTSVLVKRNCKYDLNILNWWICTLTSWEQLFCKFHSEKSTYSKYVYFQYFASKYEKESCKMLVKLVPWDIE